MDSRTHLDEIGHHRTLVGEKPDLMAGRRGSALVGFAIEQKSMADTMAVGSCAAMNE